MARQRNNNKRSNRRAPMEVVVSDGQDGDAIKVSRVIRHMDSSESLIDVLVSGSFTASIATTSSLFAYTFSNVAGEDDFVSMIQQFNLFRVKAIQWDIYDTAPTTNGTAFFSTVHLADGQAVLPTSLADVVDGPDSQMVPPGTGKARLTWAAHGTKELQFQAAAGGTYVNFGGLRAYVSAGATPTADRYRFIVKAHVQFKGRT